MTQQQYNDMVEMLISATKNGKLKWDELTGKFKTKVNNCPISLSYTYDLTINDSVYLLSLSNSSGHQFASYSFSESDAGISYKRLEDLYSAIKDSIYHISESENNILNGLKYMTGTIE